MLKTIERAGPARLTVKSVAYVDTKAFQGTVGGQAIFTQIADEEGRVVYTALGETSLGRTSQPKLDEAKAKATLFALFGRRPSAQSEPARKGRHPKPFTEAEVGIGPASGRSRRRL